MIKRDEIAVCINGLARENYEAALKNIHKVFPYDTFYMHWSGRQKPNVPDCLYMDEPTYDYHNILETKTKPDCTIWQKYTRKPEPPQGRGGKIHWKPGLWQATKDNSKQILSHYHLVNTLPKQYKTIIRIRYDLIVSTRVDFTPYIEMAQEGLVVGFGGSRGGLYGPPPFLTRHSHYDCRRCTGWYIWDHMFFHPRDRLKNVEKLYKEKDLLGAEWGLYQVLCHQWGDKNYINVDGGTVLTKHCTAPQEEWSKL
jgi:hypothetical protein